MTPHLYRVSSLTRETEDTLTFSLLPINDPLAPFLPGQFSMLYLFPYGEVPLSISGNPLNKQELVYTARSVGPITNAIGRLQCQDLVGVRGPFGSHWPLEKEGHHILLIGGGLGIAPLRSALYALLSRPEDYLSITLLYGARKKDDLLYQEELLSFTKQGVKVIISLDQPEEGWTGLQGVITEWIPSFLPPPSQTIVLLCGPEVMMKASLPKLSAVDKHSIFLSMERNMHCALGFCGHCQLGPHFLCKEGPIFSLAQVEKWLAIEGL